MDGAGPPVHTGPQFLGGLEADFSDGRCGVQDVRSVRAADGEERKQNGYDFAHYGRRHWLRFGGGIKQLEPVDASGRIIMDYSIHDAMEAGFNHIIFVIRKDIEAAFREAIGDRMAAVCAAHGVTVDYVFQDLHDIPGQLPEGRTKPWGTGQAVLAAKDLIHTPFVIINADDYYGKDGFRKV